MKRKGQKRAPAKRPNKSGLKPGNRNAQNQRQLASRDEERIGD
jgi:hypothetical protein